MDPRLLRQAARDGARARGKRRGGSGTGGGAGAQRLALCPDDEYEFAVTRVARAFGRDWWDVAARPLYRTLLGLDRLEDVERIEGLVNEGLAIVAAYRTSMAFHDGKALKTEYDGWDARTRTAPGVDPRALTADDEAAIVHIFASWTRAGVPADGVPVS